MCLCRYTVFKHTSRAQVAPEPHSTSLPFSYSTNSRSNQHWMARRKGTTGTLLQFANTTSNGGVLCSLMTFAAAQDYFEDAKEAAAAEEELSSRGNNYPFRHISCSRTQLYPKVTFICTFPSSVQFHLIPLPLLPRPNPQLPSHTQYIAWRVSVEHVAW